MVTGTRLANLGAAVRAGNFEIVSGVSPASGGANEGPDPHQLLEAALTSCTIITVQMYANRKEWPLKAVEVTTSIPSEGPEGTVIQRDIKFVGELTEEQQKRLFEIANKCPIHRLLVGNVEVKSNLL